MGNASQVDYRGFAADRARLRTKTVPSRFIDHDWALNDLPRRRRRLRHNRAL